MSDMPPYLALNDDEENSGEPDSDSSDYEDDLSLSFDKPRHLEPIKGEEREEHSWRVKEKVGAQCLFGNCDVTAYYLPGIDVHLKTNAHGLYTFFIINMQTVKKKGVF